MLTDDSVAHAKQVVVADRSAGKEHIPLTGKVLHLQREMVSSSPYITANAHLTQCSKGMRNLSSTRCMIQN